jgi:uncharacterized protein YbjT (DUF2867 family)
MIVVFGATGNIGPELVRTLVSRGVRVRAVVRDLPRARTLLPSGVELVEGDLERSESVKAALEQADRVFCGVGGPRGTPNLVDVECRLIDLAAAASVKQYVKISGIDSRPDGPSKIQRIHGEIERHLRGTGLGHTILRPSFFFQNLLGMSATIRQGTLPLPTGSARCGLIDARDLAEVAAEVLCDGKHIGQTYTLTGPLALSHGDVAAILSARLGKLVSHIDVPAAAFYEAGVGMGLPAWFVDLLTDVFVQVFATGQAERVTDDVPRILGRAARSCEQFVVDHEVLFA